ncbi:MAG: DUF924 domain-containing protein [Bdellovibrionales bacterium]|nr:DUF924 domain-containing protein [Bdellovibrionales bacterium]
MSDYKEVIEFWFEQLEQSDWWKKDEKLDKTIKDRFLKTHTAAIHCELYHWRSDQLGRLAEIIVIDQFSRNIYRDRPESFLYDNLALALSQEAVSGNHDTNLTAQQKAFLYMPYMHSESKIIHEQALTLFNQPGLETNLDFELKHKVIIDRFGRYPHRNKVLGRQSTKEEIEFLKEPNSSF